MPRSPQINPDDLTDANGVTLAEATVVEPDPAPEVVDQAEKPEVVQLVHPDSEQVIEATPDHVATWTAAGWYLKPADEDEAPAEPADEPTDTGGGQPADLDKQ